MSLKTNWKREALLFVAIAGLVDVGSSELARGAHTVHCGHERHALLLATAESLAARHEREHQRLAAPVLPERHGLSVYTQADLDAVALRLNTRPRRTLAYATLADRLVAAVASTG